MKAQFYRKFLTLGALAWFFSISLFAETASFEVSLFTGISGLLKLGDSYNKVTTAISSPFEKLTLAETKEVTQLKLSDVIFFKQWGLKVYFRKNGAVLITLQEPFKGNVRTKNIALFPFGPCPTGDWELFLTKELGIPDFKLTGGRFNSASLFYSWGDMSFNNNGPNELALYRDPLVRKFREKNFGRELHLVPTSP